MLGKRLTIRTVCPKSNRLSANAFRHSPSIRLAVGLAGAVGYDRNMVQRVCIILLGVFLWACFIPVYGVFIAIPITFLFGNYQILFWCEIAASYLLAAGSAVWVARQLWPPARSSD